jgi:DNA topoisomerase-1
MAATKVLGTDPDSGLEVTLRGGRFGPYVQLGEGADGEKPKRASLPKNTDLDAVDLDFALGLLSLPREVGKHPETGEPIVAGIGRFGSYVKHQNMYANLEEGDDVLHVGANRAVTLLAEKAARGPRGRRAPSGRLLGEHPELGGAVTQHEGRYGPYVKHGKINATLPSTSDPGTIALEEAVELLKARAERQGVKQKKTTSKKTGKKKGKAGDQAAAEAISKNKKTTAKKAAKKKAPVRKRAAQAADDEVPLKEAADEAAE